MKPSFQLPPPIRPRYVWGGYFLVAVALAIANGGAAWVSQLMSLYLIWAIVETVRFYRARPKVTFSAARTESVSEPAPEAENHSDTDDFLEAGKTIWQGSRQIRFAYSDHKGAYTDREVTVHRVVSMGRGNGDTYFRGLCHMRGEPRTFRLDRIKGNKVADTSTGELATFRQLFGLRR